MVAMVLVFAASGRRRFADSEGGGAGFGIASSSGSCCSSPCHRRLVFAIIGAVKAARMEWWRYPINIRLVKP